MVIRLLARLIIRLWKSLRRPKAPVKPLVLLAGALVLVAVACGGDEKATPEPTKPAAAPATQAPAPTATKAPAPTATTAPAPTATARPAATNTPVPTKPAGPAGSLVIARDNVGIPVGIPEACVPGCENEKFRMGVTENLFFTDKDGNVIPRLGLSWKLAPDTSTLDIVLQKGAQFHNGYGEMTAEDVAWTFQNANPTTNSKSVNDQAG